MAVDGIGRCMVVDGSGGSGFCRSVASMAVALVAGSAARMCHVDHNFQSNLRCFRKTWDLSDSHDQAPGSLPAAAFRISAQQSHLTG